MNNPASTPLLFAYSIIYFLVLLIDVSKVNANFAGLCYCGVFKFFFSLLHEQIYHMSTFSLDEI